LFIQIVKALAPTFGGINLEDIASPECFTIERRLQAMLDIPVFHDDQHGTAIILGAALLNALELTGKKIDQIKIVFCGGGAAGVACASHLLKIGVPLENIFMCDKYGLVYQGRAEEMFPEKNIFAQGSSPRTLAASPGRRRRVRRGFSGQYPYAGNAQTNGAKTNYFCNGQPRPGNKI
jgi:malate dehydrogenase (oxaloacetate-decarboxylating)(NADP+)